MLTMKITYLYLFLAFGAYACTSAVIVTNGTKQPWSADYVGDAPDGIAFLQHQDSIPAAAILLATTTIRIPTFTSLPDAQYYLHTRRLALLEAKRLGGNLVRLVRRPYSANHLEAEIYRVTAPLPERPRPGKCVLYVTVNTFRRVQGDLLFNDSVFASYPGTRKSVQGFKVDTGGFLTFREAGASFCTGVYLPDAGNYFISIGFDRLDRPLFWVFPLEMDMYLIPGSYPDTFLNKAQSLKPELSPVLTDSPSSPDSTVVVRVRGDFPRGLTGCIFFNEEPLLRFPIAVPQKEYSFMFHKNGILTYREPGSFYVKSIVVEKGQEYLLKVKRGVAQEGAHLKILDQHEVLR
jgi:hypothetical protein